MAVPIHVQDIQITVHMGSHIGTLVARVARFPPLGQSSLYRARARVGGRKMRGMRKAARARFVRGGGGAHPSLEAVMPVGWDQLLRLCQILQHGRRSQ